MLRAAGNLKPARRREAEAGASRASRIMTLAIELTDQQARALAAAAEQLQVSEVELVAAAVRDWCQLRPLIFRRHRSGCFAKKNQELYRRLA